jgi:DNA-binding transcriptional ArsR family regulator
MDCIRVYRCLCDIKRLRILNLLRGSELCVCHLQELLGEPQVVVSKQLSYMKKYQLVEAERKANWMIYRLKEPVSPLLEENLKCLQDCRSEYPEFRNDLKNLKKLLASMSSDAKSCRPISLPHTARKVR